MMGLPDHSKRKTLNAVYGAYIEYDILNLSMHNSTSTQNVLKVSKNYKVSTF